MTKFRVPFLVVSSVAMVGCAGACFADTPDDTAGSFAIKIGQLSPTDSNTKAIFGNMWQFGLESSPKGDPSSRGFLFMDTMFGGASASDGQGDSVSIDVVSLGIGYGYKYMFSPGQSARPYVGAGLGYYFNSASASITEAGVGSASGSTTSSNVGFKIYGGVTFAQHWLVELAYSNPGSVAGINLAGYSLNVGYRF